MSTPVDSSDEPPAKRQKLQTEIQRSPDFWFKKGDFVLVASHNVAYRIHADVLGRQSTVFNDLLNLDGVPRPDVEDTMDGCPVVHITDSPEDFNIFLGLVYDGFKYQRLHARWATVRVMMVLGDKYDVPDMREEGLKQLRAWYAEDIDAWDKRDKAFFAHAMEHLSVASITHTLDDPKLHAAVLYYCSDIMPTSLVRGDPATGSPPLCADDHIRVLEFILGLPRVWGGFKFEDWDADCGECTMDDLQFCEQFDNHIRSKIDWSVANFLDDTAWSALSDWLRPKTCDDCFKLKYEKPLRDMRQSFRDKLPTLFIPSE